jgi:hypothetical protein
MPLIWLRPFEAIDRGCWTGDVLRLQLEPKLFFQGAENIVSGLFGSPSSPKRRTILPAYGYEQAGRGIGTRRLYQILGAVLKL